MTTDTPLDACPNCGSKAVPFGDPKGEWECDSWNGPTGIFQSRLCNARAELSDMECEVWPEMARLKAEVAFWKAKAHEAEDREGKHEAEVERLTKQLKNYTRAIETL